MGMQSVFFFIISSLFYMNILKTDLSSASASPSLLKADYMDSLGQVGCKDIFPPSCET